MAILLTASIPNRNGKSFALLSTPDNSTFQEENPQRETKAREGERKKKN